MLAIVGVINVPIVHYSVEWWNTLHQGASITRFDKPAMPAEMLWPLLELSIATMLFYSWTILMRMRGTILTREARQSWVRELVQS